MTSVVQRGARDPARQATPNAVRSPLRLSPLGFGDQAYGVTLPRAALAFVRRHPAVVSTVVGMRDEAQVTETLRRSRVDVPGQLWAALYDEGLLDVQS
ncbi:hypothetical protein [Micromonospora sp. LH3U1]|uniref:hypothetical protein n=1 Tax=Micromonospora sp. LH3U1 TaxID=3018339 RepID=UPI00234AEC84|nr:hypothetical protein [Micromonospora sp. LH3U1]WCN84086.1 hypothetical protein PCA76_14055 [Micromonospora sp. LH3U1]